MNKKIIVLLFLIAGMLISCNGTNKDRTYVDGISNVIENEDYGKELEKIRDDTIKKYPKKKN